MTFHSDLDSPPPRNWLLWGTLLALLLHVALFKLPLPSALTGEGFLADQKKKRPEIEVERWSDSDKPVVQSSRPEEQDETKKDKPAPFAGEFKNRVRRPSQAPNRGNFQQGQIRPEVEAGDRSQADPAEEGEGDLALRQRRRGDGGEDRASHLGMNDLMAFARTPNALPKDIMEGDQTVLDTDPVRYASFINRIAAEIYDPWVQHARQAVEQVYGVGRKLDASTYITKLGILIDANGEVRGIQTVKSSGIEELDEAPKRAFWDREPFHNPPKEMFDKDELVRFVYEFHFEWKSSGFSIVPWRI